MGNICLFQEGVEQRERFFDTSWKSSYFKRTNFRGFVQRKINSVLYPPNISKWVIRES